MYTDEQAQAVATPEERTAFDTFRVEHPKADTPFARWLWLTRCYARKAQLIAMGVPFDQQTLDAWQLASLSDETRARLLFDGKSIP